MSSPASPPSPRATVRSKGRGHYDRELVHAILDEAEVCHLGVVPLLTRREAWVDC